MDDEERQLLAEAAAAGGDGGQQQQQPPAAAAAGFNAAPEAPDEDMEDDMELSGDEGDEAPMKVVKNYKRQVCLCV